MKAITRTLSFLLIALIVASLLPNVLADAPYGSDEIPADVLSYAESVAAPYCKSFMKNVDNGYMGEVFNSANEVDALTVGRGYRIASVDAYAEGKKLSETVELTSAWLIALENDAEPVAFFTVSDRGGEYGFSGVYEAACLNDAMGIIERVAENSGVTTAPILVSAPSAGEYYLMLSVDGDTRIITVPSDRKSFNNAYLSVKTHTELPTEDELKAEILRVMPPLKQGEQIRFGSTTVNLAPHLERSALLIPIISIAAGVVAIAAIVGIAVLRKKRVGA